MTLKQFNLLFTASLSARGPEFNPSSIQMILVSPIMYKVVGWNQIR